LKTLRKYHKWLSLIFGFIILLFALSGILLNHRNLISGMDLNRKLLPSQYQMNHWELGSLKTSLKLDSNMVLWYGNMGMMITDTLFHNPEPFTRGIPYGMDHQRIHKVFKSQHQILLAATQSALYRFNTSENLWKQLVLPGPDQQVVDITQVADSLYFLTRSYILISDEQLQNFKIKILPPPENYDNKIGLFKTLWVIHSGEIYGNIGRLLVDFAGLILIFLTITGYILFFKKRKFRNPKLQDHQRSRQKGHIRWNLKWHNRLGWTTVVLLIVTTATGMFLRPPLLAAIGNIKVAKIPFTELDTENPWFDQLRRFTYDAGQKRFVISTSEGVFYSTDFFKTELKTFEQQPPISVMGATVFETISTGSYLVGSFEGLFLYQPQKAMIWDVIKQQVYQAPKTMGPPIGEFLISGYSQDFGSSVVVFDYNQGALMLNRNQSFPEPTQVQKDDFRMPLWNFALEIHTARIFQSLVGDFYVLIIPLSALVLLFILISGFLIWYKLYRK